MNPEGKGGGFDFKAYDACRASGALIMTGHSPTYLRTAVMTNFYKQTVVSDTDPFVIKHGQSLAFVTGTGGRNIRRQVVNYSWFRSVYASPVKESSGPFGLLLYTLNLQGVLNQGSCEFVITTGEVKDQFNLEVQ